jgi:hypothetical protein
MSCSASLSTRSLPLEIVYLIGDYIEEYSDARELINTIRGIAKRVFYCLKTKISLTTLDRYVIHRFDMDFLREHVQELSHHLDQQQHRVDFLLDFYKMNPSCIHSFLYQGLVIQNDMSSLLIVLLKNNYISYLSLNAVFSSIIIEQNKKRYPLEGNYERLVTLDEKKEKLILDSDSWGAILINSATLGLKNIVKALLDESLSRFNENDLGRALIRACSICSYSINYGTWQEKLDTTSSNFHPFFHDFSNLNRREIIQNLLSSTTTVNSSDFFLAFKNLILLPEEEMSNEEICFFVEKMINDDRFKKSSLEDRGQIYEEVLIKKPQRFYPLIMSVSEQNFLKWDNWEKLDQICLRKMLVQQESSKDYETFHRLLLNLSIELINRTPLDELKSIFTKALVSNYSLALSILKDSKFQFFTAIEISNFLKNAIEHFPHTDPVLEELINHLIMKEQFFQISSTELNAIFKQAIEKNVLIFAKALIVSNRFNDISRPLIEFAIQHLDTTCVKLIVQQGNFQHLLPSYAQEFINGKRGNDLALFAYQYVYQNRMISLSQVALDQIFKYALLNAVNFENFSLIQALLENEDIHFFEDQDWRRIFQGYLKFIVRKPFVDSMKPIKYWLQEDVSENEYLNPSKWKEVNIQAKQVFFYEFKGFAEEEILKVLKQSILSCNASLFEYVFLHQEVSQMKLSIKDLMMTFFLSISQQKMFYKDKMQTIGKLIFNNARIIKEIAEEDIKEFLSRMDALNEEISAFIYQLVIFSPIKIDPKMMGQKLREAINQDKSLVISVLLQAKSDISSDEIHRAYRLSQEKKSRADSMPNQISYSVKNQSSLSNNIPEETKSFQERIDARHLKHYQSAQKNEDKKDEKKDETKDKKCLIQ